MKKSALLVVFVFVLLGGAIGAYFYWQQIQPKPAPTPAQVKAPAPEAPKPEVRKIIEPVPTKAPLPQLAESDSLMLDALAGLVGNKALLKLFHTEHIIHNIVATIDNLPSRQAPVNVLPVEQVTGKFLTAGNEDALIINPKNAERYAPYVRLAETIDAKKLVALYVRLYPLFQKSYEELGYPKKYFNDRLIVVIDELLDTPNVKEPIKLVQPSVFYKFADPDLEELSIGQRILIRIGNKNEATIKAKLNEIKQELLLHMHNEIVGDAE